MRTDEKSFLNSLDQNSINQLHAAILQVSQTCYDIKKLCATIMGSSVAGVVGFAQVQSNIKVGYPFFLSGAVIILFFWFLDSQNYLLQRKMRLRMKELADNIAQRSGVMLIVDGVGMPIETKKKKKNLFLGSIFNNSMIFYYLLFGLFITLAVLQFFDFFPALILKKNPQ